MQLKYLVCWITIVLELIILTACIPRGDVDTPVPNPMPPEWEPQLGKQTFRFKLSLSMVEYRGDLWTTTWAHDVLGPGFLLRFSPGTQIAKEYAVELDEGIGIPSLLLVTQNGDLWGAGMNPLPPHSVDSPNPCNNSVMPWVLSRYDPHTDRFVAIHDKDGMLRGCDVFAFAEDRAGNLLLLSGDGLKSPFFHYDPSASVEERDKALVIGSRPRIVRFNPKTREASLLSLDSQIKGLALGAISDIVVGPDDALWLIAEKDDHHAVLRLDPSTGNLIDWDGAQPTSRYGAFPRLYFDRSGRLWTSFVSWTEVRPNQPLSWIDLGATRFITPLKESPEEIYYGRVYQIYQSTDGLIWFASGAGLMTYNLDKDEWKRASPANSVIVEDEGGNIWTAAYGQFYRYKPVR